MLVSDDTTLKRIADALERLAPPPPVLADPLAAPAYVWRDKSLIATRSFKPFPLECLAGVDVQKKALLDNTARLANRVAAHDVLLWGSRGSGKSALCKSVVGELQKEGAPIALIEVAGERVDTLPDLFGHIADQPRSFVLFVDDLGFEEGSSAPRLLRSLLEGGAEARPENARLYVTANRRHIVAREVQHTEASFARDVLDDQLALADRFGLNLGFHVCNQDTYIEMVRGYAARFGLQLDEKQALSWVRSRSGLSGRMAWQYIIEIAGEQGKNISL
ncbi:MAG: ATP-binding protein [Zymomonas mobilis subsp. pomaceae]|uniref:ATP-binding protein n=1 Tax=Zymomonas mobilis TaxID=542 RepID=UPI0039E97FA3